MQLPLRCTKLPEEKNIKFIIGGSNYVTEALMPPSWSYLKNDLVNLRAIHKKFGTMSLKTYPMLSIVGWHYCTVVKNIKCIYLLNQIDYNKQKAIAFLKDNYSWREYGGKHYESLFTKFYQAYILPEKFGVDKRKPHLSTLICSGQMSRNEALKEVSLPLYNEEELKRDKEYFLKKIGLTEMEFRKIMDTPRIEHNFYTTDKTVRQLIARVLKFYRLTFKKILMAIKKKKQQDCT